MSNTLELKSLPRLHSFLADHDDIIVFFSIHRIPDETFEDLHSLEWLKLWNNELEGLSYSLMEPVLDTLKHLDIHSKKA